MGKLLSRRGVVLLRTEAKRYRVETLKGLPAELLGSCCVIGSVPNRILALTPAIAGTYAACSRIAVT